MMVLKWCGSQMKMLGMLENKGEERRYETRNRWTS